MDLSDTLGLRLPRYQQLARLLAARIERGDIAVGGLLPGEHDLARIHKVSRYTVRGALNHLQSIGLVERRHGVGTVVLAGTPPRAFAHTIGSIEQVQQYAQDTRLIGHRCRIVTADASVAAALHCVPGTRLLRIEALRIDGEHPRQAPLALTRIHVVDRYAGIRTQLRSARLAIGSLIERMFGERITAIEQDVHAVAIDAESARALHVEPGSPGLWVGRRYLGADGQPFEFATSVHPAERFGMSMRLENVALRIHASKEVV